MTAVPAKTCPSCSERYDSDVLFCPRDGTPLVPSRASSAATERDPYLGSELPGQIRLDHLIGIGSMGRVYRAFQGGIERDVAVKVLHRELSGNPELVGRFHREAKVASRLLHPNVVQVLMTGALPHGRDPRIGGELYLVMEHLDGISLLSALAAAGTGEDGQALPLPRALHVALQICDAVGEAHAQGIVHRDLKPENVMLVRRGDDSDYVKVLDFGIARLRFVDLGMATQAGLIFGTAKYISPEGAEGHAVEPPADVYSIATVLYQMLAGRTPFEGDSPVALLVQHTHAPPLDLRSIARASYVPAPLAAVIMQNLSKRPSERAEDACAFGRDLVNAARASGLFPEGIAPRSRMFSPASVGAVKLASKERTRAHELSADLATRIGGVAASADSHVASRGPEEGRVPTPTLPSVHARSSTTARALMAFDDTAPPENVEPSLGPVAYPTEDAGTQLDVDSLAGLTESDRSLGLAATQIDLELSLVPPSLLPERTVPGTPLPDPTMRGTETSAMDDEPMGVPRRTWGVQIVALVAFLLIAVPLGIIGGRTIGVFGGGGSGDSVEGSLSEARDAERRHAWDSPPGHNFKDITDRALARFADHRPVLDLRREAAERVVSDALGRKYENDVPGALRLARLALDFDPTLTTAQHLVVELEKPPPADVPTVATATARPTDRNTFKGPRRPKGVDPRAAPESSAAIPRASSTPPHTASRPTPPEGSPPQPPAALPPLPSQSPPTAPSTAGPWL